MCGDISGLVGLDSLQQPRTAVAGDNAVQQYWTGTVDTVEFVATRIALSKEYADYPVEIVQSYLEAETIDAVVDNLTSHTRKAMRERSGQKMGGLLWDWFILKYTPQPVSWLNQAIETGVSFRQCLGRRRIPSPAGIAAAHSGLDPVDEVRPSRRRLDIPRANKTRRQVGRNRNTMHDQRPSAMPSYGDVYQTRPGNRLCPDRVYPTSTLLRWAPFAPVANVTYSVLTLADL